MQADNTAYKERKGFFDGFKTLMAHHPVRTSAFILGTTICAAPMVLGLCAGVAFVGSAGLALAGLPIAGNFIGGSLVAAGFGSFAGVALMAQFEDNCRWFSQTYDKIVTKEALAGLRVRHGKDYGARIPGKYPEPPNKSLVQNIRNHFSQRAVRASGNQSEMQNLTAAQSSENTRTPSLPVKTPDALFPHKRA